MQGLIWALSSIHVSVSISITPFCVHCISAGPFYLLLVTNRWLSLFSSLGTHKFPNPVYELRRESNSTEYNLESGLSQFSGGQVQSEHIKRKWNSKTQVPAEAEFKDWDVCFSIFPDKQASILPS